MFNYQIRVVFADKQNVPAPLTEKLIADGCQQKRDGYSKYAESVGIQNPSQYWHLMESWSARSVANARFDKRIQCGELLFWMAEVLAAVPYKELDTLISEVLKEPNEETS